MEKFNAGWYLIYTRPQHEKKVWARLTEMSISSFLPTTKKLRAWHDRKKYIDMPLFPSYVFVFLKSMDDYYRGLETEGVLYYVRSGKVIAKVNESVVNNIRLLVEKGDNEIEVSTLNLRPGQELSICEGPLTGLSCEMIHLDGRQKVLVRVNLLQRNLLITLPQQYLMPATA